eukprot:211824-Prymnesium_polylepis.1
MQATEPQQHGQYVAGHRAAAHVAVAPPVGLHSDRGELESLQQHQPSHPVARERPKAAERPRRVGGRDGKGVGKVDGQH